MMPQPIRGCAGLAPFNEARKDADQRHQRSEVTPGDFKLFARSVDDKRHYCAALPPRTRARPLTQGSLPP